MKENEEEMVRVCSCCGLEVINSWSEKYDYECLGEWKGLYECETLLVPRKDYEKYIADAVQLSLEETSELIDRHREYVRKSIDPHPRCIIFYKVLGPRELEQTTLMQIM